MILFAIILSGCVIAPTGHLYTNITHPQSTDFSHTPVGTRACILDSYEIEEPLTSYGISVEWSANQIKQEAKKSGIDQIAYTDEQISSYLMGIYTFRKLIIYGD
jgi:hypothetical protein